jgi:hypothetical protein
LKQSVLINVSTFKKTWNFLKIMHLLVFICFKPKWGKASKSTTISCSIEPLKDTPQEAEWEELAQDLHLFPAMVEKESWILSHAGWSFNHKCIRSDSALLC